MKKKGCACTFCHINKMLEAWSFVCQAEGQFNMASPCENFID